MAGPGRRGRPDGGDRPGKESHRKPDYTAPDKLSGGSMPPAADPKKGGK